MALLDNRISQLATKIDNPGEWEGGWGNDGGGCDIVPAMVAELDFFDPQFQANPYPAYAKMRAAGLYRIQPFGFYALSRHADVVSALKAPEKLSSSGFTDAYEPDWLGRNPALHSMLTMDPPEHTKLRGLVGRAFSGSVLARVEPQIEGLVQRLVAELGERKEADVVEALGTPLTAGVLGHFLGIEPALHRQIKHWTDALLDVTPQPRDESHAARVRHALREFEQCMHELLRQRRANVGDDLTSQLLQATVDGKTLDEPTLVGLLMLLVIAGIETTVNLIAKAVLQLGNQPELYRRIREKPSLVPRFVEEMLRWEPPTHSLFRLARQDVYLGGGTIPAGSLVMLMLAAANRDPEVFADPDRFDLDRDTQRHTAFGHGPHLCIGLGLARLEARYAFEALTRRFSALELAPQDPVFLHTLTVRALPHLQIRCIE